jgi:hypothetical protein
MCLISIDIITNETLPGMVYAVVVVPVVVGPAVVVGVHVVFPLAGAQKVVGPPVKRRLRKEREESISAWTRMLQQMAREMQPNSTNAHTPSSNVKWKRTTHQRGHSVVMDGVAAAVTPFSRDSAVAAIPAHARARKEEERKKKRR